MLNAHFLKTLIPLCCPGSNEASLLNNKIHFGARQICILFFFLYALKLLSSWTDTRVGGGWNSFQSKDHHLG